MSEIQDQEYGVVSAPVEAGRTGPAWESSHGIGLLRGLVVTLEGSLLSPTQFFRAMRRDGGFLAPLVYAIIVGSLSIAVSVIWAFALSPARSPSFDVALSEEILGIDPVVYYGLSIILSPITVTILVLVTSAVLHLALLVFGGANRGFQTSFRVVCYSQSAGVLNLAPYVGWLTGSIWNLVLLAKGLRESHQTQAWRAILAVLAPLALLVALVFLGVRALRPFVAASGFL